MADDDVFDGPPPDAPKAVARVIPSNDAGGNHRGWMHVDVPEGEDPFSYVPIGFFGPIAPNKFCRGGNSGRPDLRALAADPNAAPGKYCRMLAGWGTDHLGSGRCKRHEGRPITTGKRVRYAGLHHRTIGDLVKKFADDPDPLNCLAELDLARALLVDFIERHEEFTSALLDWHKSFKRVKQPIDEEHAASYERVVTEYAILLKEGGGDPTDLQLGDLTRAQKFVEAYRKPVDQGRPRKTVDILDARMIIDSIGKLIDKLDKRDTISEPELNRIFQAMGRVVDVIVPDAEQKRLIREGWMRAVTR